MKLFLNTLLVFVSFALSLLAAESLVRLFAPQQLILIRPDVWCPERTIGWKLCPNVDAELNSGEGAIRLHTDGEGHRIDPARRLENPDRRLLAIGDSFIEAIQVGDGATTPEMISRLLEQRNYGKIAVVNSGVGQWDPNHYLIAARQELAKSYYDLGLVFLYLGNDIVEETVSDFEPRQPTHHRQVRMDGSRFHEIVVDKILYPINDFLRTRSHLFILTKETLSILLMRLGLTGNSISPVFLKSHAASTDWGITASICRKIADEFKSHQAETLFILIPTSYQVDPSEFERFLKGFGIPRESTDLDQPNRILSEALRSSGLDVLDPTPRFREQQAQGEKLYGSVDNHLNARGYESLAAFVVPFVERKLGL